MIVTEFYNKVRRGVYPEFDIPQETMLGHLTMALANHVGQDVVCESCLRIRIYPDVVTGYVFRECDHDHTSEEVEPEK